MKPSWDKYFMNIAEVIATRSPDLNTKVGCVIVDKNNRILSTGYNGSPPNFPHIKEDWKSPNKNKIVIHAEANAILFARTDLTNCTLYCTHEPCLQCAKLICGAGIKKVVYLNNREDEDAFQLFKVCDVRYRKLLD